MVGETIARRWFYVSVSIVIFLLLWFAWWQINRVDRRIGRLMASLPEVAAYIDEYYEGEAGPLDVWLTGQNRFLSFYSVGADDLTSPNYAEMLQVGELEIYCTTTVFPDGTNFGIHLTNLSAVMVSREIFTPLTVIRSYDKIHAWALALATNEADAAPFSRKPPPGLRYYDEAEDFRCWTKRGTIPPLGARSPPKDRSCTPDDSQTGPSPLPPQARVRKTERSCRV